MSNFNPIFNPSPTRRSSGTGPGVPRTVGLPSEEQETAAASAALGANNQPASTSTSTTRTILFPDSEPTDVAAAGATRAVVFNCLKLLGVSYSTEAAALILCNLLIILDTSPMFYAKMLAMKTAADNLADLKTYFEAKHPSVLTTLCSASSGDARVGVRVFGELLASFVFKHSLTPVVAQAMMVYILMVDSSHEKMALVQIVFDAYIQIQDVELEQFLHSCDQGIDLKTLQLLSDPCSDVDMWDAPGVRWLCAANNPAYFQFEMERLWIALVNILCKKPADINALQLKCEALVYRYFVYISSGGWQTT